MNQTDDRKYFIYLTTNNINGMKYVGKRFGYEDDSYLGSGTRLLQAIKEYGKENFSRIILTYSKDEDENARKEKEFIKLFNAVQDPMFYNIHEGGHGGNTMAGWSEEEKAAFSKACSERLSGPGNPRWGVHLSEETKQKIRENRDTSYMYTQEYHNAMSKATSGEKNGMYGKNHTEESKQKMSEAKIGKKLGAENGNAKGINAYLDEAHMELAYHFNCIKDALIFVGTKPTDYSGISKGMKLNRKYKGFYWEKL